MVEVVCVWKHNFYVLKGKEKIANKQQKQNKSKQITGMTKREKAG